MAATTFKQICPSCEAPVPIKDPKLIGRKIDCPKCKYRFVVEEPEDTGSDEEDVGGNKNGKASAVTARRPVNGRGAAGKSGGARAATLDDNDDAPPKKKGGLSTTLILGIGLGAVALVLLVVGILAATGVFSSGSKPATPTTNNPGSNNPGGDDDKKDKNPGPPPLQLADPTNFLPNETENVLNIRGDKLIESPAGRAAFYTPGSFSHDAFQKKFGFPPENISQLVAASNDTVGWVFNVIRTAKPVHEVDLVNLDLKKVEKKVGEFEYFLIQSNLESFAFHFLSAGKNRKDLALHMIDERTLIIGSEATVVKFLEDKRQPQRLSEPPARVEPDEDPDKPPDGKDGGPKPPGGGQVPPGGGMAGMAGAAGGGPFPPGAGMAGAAGAAGGGPFPPGAGMAGAAGGGPVPPGAGMAGAAGGGPFPPGAGMGGAAGGGPPGGPIKPGVGEAGGGPMPPGGGNIGGPFPPGTGFPPTGGPKRGPSASASYLTINPMLKSMLDKLTLPESAKQPTLIVGAIDARAGESRIRNNIHLLNVDASLFVMERVHDVQTIGFCVKAFTDSETKLLVGFDCKSDDSAKGMEKAFQEKLPLAASFLSEALETPVTAGTSSQPGKPGVPPTGGPFPPGGYGPGGGPFPPGGYGPTGGPFPPGGGASGGPFPPGGGAIGGPFPPGGGASGGPFPPGGGAIGGPFPPGGGASGGPFPPGGGAKGGPFPPGMGASGGPFPPGGRPPDTTPGGKPGEEPSTLSSSRVENTVIVTADFHLKEAASDRAFTKMVQKILHIKGEADMMSGKSRIHDLAAAVHAYAQEKHQFPRGTADRKSTTDRAGLPFRPDQRVSWMAELLPYLGQGEYARLRSHIDDQQSWRVAASKDNKDDPDRKNNRFVSQALIPYFLASDSSPTSWWVNYPGVDYPVASTHFVGIAGIGLDAASYSATDPAVAKKLGVFGYDRATKLEDVKDGLDKTIVLLQVPTDVKTCWLAGGGSTIRGVPETDPIQPFVCTIYNGKQGTFAIMGDGKVRFIDKDMNPEIFKGMCTINGGEVIGDLDAIAPIVPGGEAVLKPELPPGVKPPVDNTPKPPDDVLKPPVEGTKPSAEEAKPPVKGVPVPPPSGATPPPGKP
jgi:hypothetical protein